MKTNKNLVYHEMKPDKGRRIKKRTDTKLKYGNESYPLEVDWTASGKASSVKDQV